MHAAEGLDQGQMAAPGTAPGRSGRGYLREDGGQVWVGGDVVTAISGEIAL